MIPTDVQSLQLYASTILAFSSVIVAILTYRMSRKNNFGWKPLLLVTDYSFDSGRHPSGFDMFGITCEVWNRRTYPINIRSIKIRPGSFKFDVHNLESMYPPEDLRVFGSRAVVELNLSVPVEPKAIKEKKIEIPMVISQTSSSIGSVRVTAVVFDPIENRTYNLITDHIFHGHLSFMDWIKDYRNRIRVYDPPPPHHDLE